MIPLHDENPCRNFPHLTILLIGSNIFVFLYSFSLPQPTMYVFAEYGLIPYQLVHSPPMATPTIFSSMFLHAGLGHLLGNMLYLWIFGNNIEDVLGKSRFILFYFLCGIIAALCHVSAAPDSQVPMVGASGAISGILGGYMVLFPFAKVRTLVFLGFFITIIRVPALILLGLWMLFQILSSVPAGGDGAGVAWYAHIGGFLAGVILIKLFTKRGV